MNVGTKLANRYEITGQLGRGGMGVVFRAHDPFLDRDVAVKLVTPEFLSPDVEVRFLREAQIVARMDHPSIVTVHDIGRHEGSLFFVMPIVRGVTLRDLVESRSLSLADALNAGAQMASALEYSHNLGVVHRDMKPDNVMVAREGQAGIRARIMDFGLAYVTYESQMTRITRRGTLLGTVAYFSPEQVEGRDVDGRADLYALGSILYECFVGEPPFVGDTQSVLYRIVHERPDPPSARGAETPPDVEALVMRCLAKDAADRPRRARDVADVLARVAARLTPDEQGRLLATQSTLRVRAHHARNAAIPFVGRGTELAALVERVDRAALGDCQLVLVAGEVGAGKSRLLDELEIASSRRGARVVHGRLVDEDRALPYQMFCEAIQDFFAGADGAPDGVDLSEVAADLVAVFPALADVPAVRDAARAYPATDGRDEAGDRTAVFELLARAFGRMADAGPLVVLFEDLHRGNVSVEALKYLARRLGPTRIAFVASYRPSEAPKGHPIAALVDSFAGDRRFAEVFLGPLAPDAHRALVEALLGGRRASDATAKRFLEATEGNPLFTRELIRALLDAGLVDASATESLNLSIEMGLPTDTLPATIQQAIERRVEGLPAELRDVLVVAAVLGRGFESKELAAMVDAPDQLEDAVERLIQLGLLSEAPPAHHDRLAFSSAVVRDVLYATSSRRRRRTLHRRFAEYLEARHADRIDRVVAQLAHHYAHGDVPQKAVDYGLRAARLFHDAYSFDDARRALGVVLEFLEYEWDGDRAVEGEARLLLALVFRRLGNIDGACREAREAVRIFETARQPARAVAAAAAAAEAAWTGRRVAEARSWIDHALPAARTGGFVDEHARLLALGVTAANLAGDRETASAFAAELERVAGVAPPAEAVPAGGVLRVPIGPETPFDRIDPMLAATDQQADIFSCVFETLTRIGDGARVVPWLAEELRSDADGRTFVFRLRDGVRFHDGRALEARDVRASFERLLRERDSRGRAQLSVVRGADRVIAGSGERLEGFRELSEREFVVELARPVVFFPTLLSDPCFAIVHEGEAGCAGTGPFRVAAFEPNARVVLERNTDYWRPGVPRCDGVEFVLNVPAREILDEFRAGRYSIASGLHSADVDALRLTATFGPALRDAPAMSTAFLALNTSRGPLADADLRRRLVAAVNVPDLVRRTLIRLTTPATTLVPPSLLGLDVPRVAAEPGAASGPGVEVTAIVSPAFATRLGAVRDGLFEALGAAGIAVRELGVWLSDYRDAHRTGEVDMILTMWAADYPDADAFAHALLHRSEGLLGAFCGSAEIDRLVDAARVERDSAARSSLYRQLEDLLARDAVLLPLFHPQKYRFAQPTVEGLTVNPFSFPIVPYDEIWLRPSPSSAE